MVVCVNNLGALSCLEMAVVTRAAVMCLGNYGNVCPLPSRRPYGPLRALLNGIRRGV